MLGIVSHADCNLHDPGPDHPDCPERLDAIQNQIISSGVEFVLRHYDAPLATRGMLEAAHDPAHVAHVFATVPEAGTVQIDDDTMMTPYTLRAALRAAGAAVLAVDLVMRGEACPVFCAVRPPGHHAERNRAMGFCLFNNVAVGALHAMDRHGIERLAILDFDVHHGNGTEDIFRDDPRVLLCSSFQHPFYPFTGDVADRPNLVSVPMKRGTGGPAFRAAIAEQWFPAVRAFAPELILVSAGFDAHILDDMSGLALAEADYAWLSEQIMAVARESAEGRVVSVLEGGYEPGALGRSVVAYLKAMI